MSSKKGNIGTKMLILQEQYNHQKRLNQIYKKNLKDHNFSINSSKQYENIGRSSSKQSLFQQRNHTLLIKRLSQVINSDKKMSDRIKDPNDFIAYPSLFFREVQTNNQTKRLKMKKKSRKTQVVQNEDQMEYTISKEKIKQHLPILTNFDMSDLQQLADGLNKMIITFNITTKQQLRNLEHKILSLMPSSSPHDFLEATIALFRQAEEQMQ